MRCLESVKNVGKDRKYHVLFKVVENLITIMNLMLDFK